MDQRRVNAVAANTFVTNPNLSSVRQLQGRRSPPVLRLGQLERRRNTRRTHATTRMMFRMSRRFANNLAVNFNYTRSSAMDLLDNDSDNIINPFNMRQNWGKAGYDQTERIHHRLRLRHSEGEGRVE